MPLFTVLLLTIIFNLLQARNLTLKQAKGRLLEYIKHIIDKSFI